MTKFVNPGDIIAQLNLKKGQVVADFGCGAGFYSLAAAQFVADDGMVYAVDIMPDLSQIAGVVLAGGKSSRMGRNKAFLEFGKT